MGCLTLECYVNNLADGRSEHEGMGGLLRKEKREAGDTIGAKEKPRRIEPTGLGDWLGLITRQGRQNEKEGKKETQPEVA